MKVKTLNCLQPAEYKADGVVVEDDAGNAIFAAVHVGDAILCTKIGEPEHNEVLNMLGITPPNFTEIDGNP